MSECQCGCGYRDSDLDVARKAFDRNQNFLPIGDEWNASCEAMDRIECEVKRLRRENNALREDLSRVRRAVEVRPAA